MGQLFENPDAERDNKIYYMSGLLHIYIFLTNFIIIERAVVIAPILLVIKLRPRDLN